MRSMLSLKRGHKRILVAMAKNNGLAIVSADDLDAGPIKELIESALLQVFRVGRINDISVEVCLTTDGWKTAQRLRYRGDGDGAPA